MVKISTQLHVSSIEKSTYMIGRHGRNGEGVVRGSSEGGGPGIAPSADTSPLRRRRRPLMPMVLLLVMVLVAVIAGHAATAATSAARRVGGR